jgi:crossover junction endodeoxyribonuclease RuvC
MIVLGIDPGTAETGYGFITLRRKTPKIIDCGLIKTESQREDAYRLLTMEKEIRKLIRLYKPDILAIESIFFFQNRRSALAVSQMKGIVLLAAEKHKLPIYEFSPLEIKLAITGWGRADKEEMRLAVQELFVLPENNYSNHATDAIGAAACYLIKNKYLEPIDWQSKKLS